MKGTSHVEALKAVVTDGDDPPGAHCEENIGTSSSFEWRRIINPPLTSHVAGSATSLLPPVRGASESALSSEGASGGHSWVSTGDSGPAPPSACSSDLRGHLRTALLSAQAINMRASDLPSSLPQSPRSSLEGS